MRPFNSRSGASVAAVLVLLAATIPVGGGPPGNMALAPGDRAPLLGGTLYPSGEYVRDMTLDGGALTLVNFWATWCRPCLEEMPGLQRVQNKYAAAGFRIIGVIDQPDVTVEKIRDFLEPVGVKYAVLRADHRVNANWGWIAAIPTSFLVDGNGRILRRYVGGTREQVAGLEADIEALLEGRPMPLLIVPVEEETVESNDGK